MKNKSRNEKQISRRNILSILGSSLLIPFLGFGNSTTDQITFSEKESEQEFQTLLKPDGTVVKVKLSTLKKSKTIKKNMSNKSLLNWLTKKQ